jgi:thiol-disulfide isomerase/thioredoxin
MRKINQKLIIVTAFLFLFLLLIQPVLAEEKIVLEFFYSSGCKSCTKYLPAIDKIETMYNETVAVQKKDERSYENYQIEYEYYRRMYNNLTGNIVVRPFVVIRNETNVTILTSSNLAKDQSNVTPETVNNIRNVIEAYLAGLKPNVTNNEYIVSIDFLFWHFKLDASSLTLPVLTIILAGVDSFNPCIFFILIFLLNLLIYARSRRRMLLIGGVFIFFSALFYFIFMVLLLHTFQLTLEFGITAIVVGTIALILGSINIKDFFFFKKGASISIPEDKKPNIYKRMRNLLKTPQIFGVLIGTITLAIVVNFYELLCSITLPAFFTSKLALSNLSDIQNYMYIFFYNVIYVIPMIIIVLIFVVTLGKRKLSEWQGRILKLLSGVMMVSFGTLFLLDITILENVATPVLLLIFSLLATLVISYIWKKYKDKKEAM